MKKLNVAELLKDCPSGMELDCNMYDNVSFVKVTDMVDYPIVIKTKSGFSTKLTKYGQNINIDDAKCVIFPKGKTTWEGFQRPFKDGDVVFFDDSIAIFKEWGDETLFKTYVKQYIHKKSIDIDFPLFGKYIRKYTRFATEEEKQKLFQAIKDNGYRWNPETKTLEKLIVPKFKIGDRITNGKISITISHMDNVYYYQIRDKSVHRLSVEKQDDWKLDKFDITTLKPFESRVLVRYNEDNKWCGAFFSHIDKEYHSFCYAYVTTAGKSYPYCIPYESNEHLLNKTDDCDNYYKTWE